MIVYEFFKRRQLIHIAAIYPMKKLINSTLSIFCIFFLTTGCSKNNTEETKYKEINIGETIKDFLLKAQMPKDGMINIQSFKQAGSLIPQSDQPFDGYVGGAFYINKDESKSTTVSTFSIDNFDIPYNNYAPYPG